MQEILCTMIIICCLLNVVCVIKVINKNGRKDKTDSHSRILEEGEKPSGTIKPSRPVTSKVTTLKEGRYKRFSVKNTSLYANRPDPPSSSSTE